MRGGERRFRPSHKGDVLQDEGSRGFVELLYCFGVLGPQGFERGARELGELVQEQNAVVRARDLARPRWRAACKRRRLMRIGPDLLPLNANSLMN